MSTVKIVTIICWVISAVVLIGLLIWFLTGSVFGGWSNRLGDINLFGNNIGSLENLTGPFEVDGVYTVGTDTVDSIQIDWVAGDVTVKPHDGNDITITEYAQRGLRDNEKLRYSMSGNTLEIRFRDRSGSARMPQKRLEVLVPSELSKNLSILTINSVSGSIAVTDMYASILNSNSTSGSINVSGAFSHTNIGTVSGSITLNNLALGTNADIETISGGIEMTGTFDKVNTSAISGSTSFTSTQVPSSFKADSVSGSVTITLPGDAAISVNHSSVSGRLQSDLPVTMEGKGAQIDISTVSGSTSIRALG